MTKPKAMSGKPQTAGDARRLLHRLVREAEDWAAEYIKREELYRQRGAHREAAHYEDLRAAHQGHAAELRRILAMLPNDKNGGDHD